MPVHRVSQTPNVAALEEAVATFEKAGETVVQVINWEHGWLVVTTPAPGLRVVIGGKGGTFEERVA